MGGIVPVAIALGSNIGDRHGHLSWAVEQLGLLLTNLRVSSFVDTAPYDVPGPQPPYLNAAVVGETSLEPRPLMETLLALERERGRERLSARAPRTLDLDLILYGDQVVDEPGVMVPHPRFRERQFVLKPLSEIAADWRDPKTGKTVMEIFNQLRA